MAPAAAIHHLLIRQDSSALGTPVDLALLAISQAFLVELEEEPLIPLVVFRQAGSDFAGPIVCETQAGHLGFHSGDVLQSPLAGWRIVCDRRVLSWKPERIPSHGMEHVIAIHPRIAGQCIPN